MAYEALSPKMKELAENLSSIHDHAKVKGADSQPPEVLERLRRTQPPVESIRWW